jgi:hypothetical protein
MSSTSTAPIVHTEFKALAVIWPPTSDVARETGHRPQSPLRAIRAKPGTRAGNFVARRYRLHPAFADLVANLAGLGSEASST